MAILPHPDDLRETDPIAALIKKRRQELGLTLEALARQSGIKSRSYLHHIENGDKVPDEDKAARIARAIGEDEETFRAWARIRGGRNALNWKEAAESVHRLAAEAIANVQRDPRHEVVFALLRKPTSALGVREPRVSYADGEASKRTRNLFSPPTRFLVVRSGADPGDRDVPEHVVACIELYPEAVASAPQLEVRLERLERPYAYHLTPAHARRFLRTNILPPTFYAVVTRDIVPIEAHEIYVVRTKRGIEFGYLRWDGMRLLLMPSDDQADFEVWDAPGSRELRQIVAGKIALLLPAELVTLV